MYRKVDPTPKATHRSSGVVLLNEATASTTTSVSTVRMVTFLHPFCTASATCRSRRVSASSCEHGPSMTQQESRGLHFHLLHTVPCPLLEEDEQLRVTGKQTIRFCSHRLEGSPSSSLASQ